MTNSTHAAVSILIGADLGKSFRDSFSGASKQLSALGDAIKKVNDKASEIEAFRKSSRATKEASIAYQEAKQKLNLLSAEISKTDKPSKELQNNFRKSQVAAQRTKTAFMESAQATRAMGKALSASGVDFKNFNGQQEALNKTLAALKKNQSALQNNADAKSQNLSNRANYRGQMVDAVALGGALYKAVKPAVDFEFAMARVGAVTEEAANSSGFKKLTAKARELGNTTQYTSAEAAKAMQLLGMSGFNTNQILAATPAILNLAIADNMELGESAEIVSNILNGFGMKAEEAGRASDILAQAAVATSTDVRTLGETMKFVAPAAASVGGTLEETAALAGVLGNAGIKASMAGTMLRSAYLRLAAPARAGAKALGKMRDEMQISAEEMPDVAKEAILAQMRLKGLGVKIFDKGKMRSMIDILRDLHKATKNLSDDKRIGAVKDIFGTYATSGALNIFKAFDKKSDETGSVDQVLDKIKNSAGTAQNIANRLNDTAVGAFRELDSSVESIGISFGNTLLPAISSTARTVANFASHVSALAEKFPVTTKYIGMTITGLIGLKIATIALGYAFTFIKGPFLWMHGALLAMRARMLLLGLSMPVVTTAIRAMSLALLTSPITWIVAGIAGAAYLLIKNWTPVGKFFKNLFSGIVGWAQAAFNWISKFTSPLKPIVSAVGNFAGKAWNFVSGNSDAKNSSSSTVGSVVGNFDVGKSDIGKISPFEMPNIAASPSGNGAQQISISAPITINAGGNVDEKKIAYHVKIALDETFRKLSARKLALNYDQ
jgi:TP901 family phage tail tape measure protein